MKFLTCWIEVKWWTIILIIILNLKEQHPSDTTKIIKNSTILIKHVETGFLYTFKSQDKKQIFIGQ